MSCIGLVHVCIEAVFSLCSISKVEIEITAREWVLSRGHISPCGTGGSRIGFLSFWLAVSLNVSAAQPELCRSTACIAAVTCMGGLWEMERFQLKRAASVLPVWKRRGAESWRLQPSQLYVVRASSTTDLAVKGHNVRFSTQPHPTWCLPPALTVGFCSRDIVYSGTNKQSHTNTETQQV